MKRLIAALALAVFCYSTPSFCQGGLIGLYLDTWGNVCDFKDNSCTVLEVYVVHKSAPEATGCQFAIYASSGFTGIYMGEETPLVGSLGNSQTGVAIGYGECLSSPINILTIRYLIFGTSEPNSYLEVVAHPTDHLGLAMVDCQQTTHPAFGGRAYINGDGSVSCGAATPTEPTTWGRIKSIYQQ